MSNTHFAPRDLDQVQACYRQHIDLHQTLFDLYAQRRNRALQGVGALALAMALAVLGGIHWALIQWVLLAGFLSIIALVWYSLHQQTHLTREQRLLSLYRRSLQRADGTQPQSGRTGMETGQELRQPGHIYDHDLDILGSNSLFGLLAVVRTGPGERGLAQLLLQPATHQESLLRQQAVKELLPQLDLREKIALLGTTSFQQIKATFFDEWLDQPPPVIHPGYRIALYITASLNVLLLVAGLARWISSSTFWLNFALVFTVHALICFSLRERVRPILERSAQIHQNVQFIADGLALMQSHPFASARLRELQALTLEPAGSTALLNKLASSLGVVEQRSKGWFFVLSLLLAAGTQAAISIAAWKRSHADSMRIWLQAWSEFEALNALATFAFEHPAGDGLHCWPDLLPPQHPPTYEATSLGHPLLTHAVTNDIALSPDCRFYLLSGSNMSGKSTLLRSIGINAVLAYGGAPVRATSLRLTPLTLGASLSLTDSLAEGRSKFLAEVERLSAILTTSHTSPVLFVVDEIFSGTNSEDRRTAAGAILSQLLANGAIGALSTHDLALTQLVSADNRGLNVHMASPDPADPLAFDYKIKPGPNTASSARAILHLIGIDI